VSISLLGICGSLRTGSLNRALLTAVGAGLPEGATLRQWESLDFPIFRTGVGEPTAVTELRQAISAADGVVFAVPEYNYSIPGGLKNALDWLSSPPPRSPLRGKPCGLIGAASGMSGTIRAQAHLRQRPAFGAGARRCGQADAAVAAAGQQRHHGVAGAARRASRILRH
jgi:chromate reductase